MKAILARGRPPIYKPIFNMCNTSIWGPYQFQSKRLGPFKFWVFGVVGFRGIGFILGGFRALHFFRGLVVSGFSISGSRMPSFGKGV